MAAFEKEFYYRNLPHIVPLGGTFFVTSCLAGAFPKEVLEKFQEEYELAKKQILKNPSASRYEDLIRLGKIDFIKRDNYLDSTKSGNHFLKDEKIAQIVANSLHFWDDKKIELMAYCIMSNHYHIVLRLFDEEDGKKGDFLPQMMKSINAFSGRECNKVLGLSGDFWQHESYDRLVRNGTELTNIIRYVLNNPVKAGLCEKWENWKFSYVKEGYF